MLTTQFFGLNLYFAVNLLAALVCFGVFWLIYDAWTGRRHKKEALKWAGFLMLSLGFLLRATAIQSQSGQLSQWADYVASILRAIGYIGIVAGQLLDPLQPRPMYSNGAVSDVFDDLPKDPTQGGAAGPPPSKPRRGHHAFFVAPALSVLLPGLAALGSLLYWRRASTGLERHLRPVAWGFGP